MKVLLGGGTGFIGRTLHKALLERGHIVTVISRNPGKDRVTWTELKREASLPECEAVVNLSGENILQPFRRWNDSYKKDVHDSRIGLNNVLVKLMKEGVVKPKVWVSAHAEGYYPRNNDLEVNEDLIVEKPTSYMQQLCCDWEKSAQLPADENIRHAGVRIGVVLGKHGGLIGNSYWPFWFGLGGTIGSGRQNIPWVHVKDLSNIFVHAIENENVCGMLNGVSPGHCTMYDFTKAYGRALNRPTIFPVPEFLINLAAGAERAPLLLTCGKINPKRTIESGFTFEFTDINDAMKDIVG